MSLELVAVDGMTAIVDQSTVNPPGTVSATIVVNPPTGTKCRGEGKLVHRDGDTITVSAITVPGAGATTPDPGPYTVAMENTATKTKAEGVEVLVLGDQSETINATPKIPGSPPADYPVSFKCVIQNSGQTTSRAQ